MINGAWLLLAVGTIFTVMGLTALEDDSAIFSMLRRQLTM
jgi:hypothetical protein